MMPPGPKFTPTEWKIYQFILANKEKVISFSLRQLALKLEVSPASVVRTIKKMGYSHYQDLSEKLKHELNIPLIDDDITFQAIYYFHQSIIDDYTQKINIFKRFTQHCTDFIFYGIGTSQDLAAYGARQFVNNGYSAFVVSDPFYPIDRIKNAYHNKIVIVLSVSGETTPTVEQVINFRANGAKIISITNNSDNTIANLSDLNFCYLLESKVVGRTLNLTSQIPVVYILERLSRSLQN
ncbi:MurR/RpiR family transcriptional regulator [Bombilactobacillus bombi]|uniref:MurR/RpiR family transcriptional regulator n=1 Tax=Bombilactobacillus bombi TaxID=1303590 RepID=UPI0015E5F084|nr:MurR/RpiR family transcriptional regulator [Bombilactobacillus bombi]MBA1434558.1 MurR/RpiR family transcriptional regulator [Bombilactobacillus bombi]